MSTPASRPFPDPGSTASKPPWANRSTSATSPRPPAHRPADRRDLCRARARDQEQDERRHVHGYGRDDQRPAPYVVGQGPEDQQRREQEQHVDGEHRGQRGRRKSPPCLVDAVQRGRHGGRIGEQDHHRHRHPERRRLGQRMPSRPRLGEPALAMTEPGHSGGRRPLRDHAVCPAAVGPAGRCCRQAAAARTSRVPAAA